MSHYYYFYYQNSKLSFILDGAVSAIEPAVLKESYASLYTLVLEAAKHDADSSSIRWVKIIAGLLLVYSVKFFFFFFPFFMGGGMHNSHPSDQVDEMQGSKETERRSGEEALSLSFTPSSLRQTNMMQGCQNYL